jgi:hypothetical protein
MHQQGGLDFKVGWMHAASCAPRATHSACTPPASTLQDLLLSHYFVNLPNVPHPQTSQIPTTMKERVGYSQVPSLLLTINIYAPVPASVIAMNGQTLNGLCPGVGFGPATRRLAV